jgi:hypothetical protein
MRYNRLNTNIFICHENELGDNQAFYRFNLRNNSLNIAYEARSRPGVQPYAIGDADLSRYMDGAKSALFRIYIDRINHILAVEINNKNVGVWHADLGENTPPGGNFQIRGNPGHPTTLRNLVIREWNGFPKTIVIDNYKAHENFDTIINLKNEPQLGSILNITSNKENQRIITMQSNNDTPTEIPSAQVHFIVLGQNNDLIKQNIQNSAQQTTSILMVDGNQFEVSNIKFHKDKLSFNVLENETITSLPFNEIVKIDFHDNE